MKPLRHPNLALGHSCLFLLHREEASRFFSTRGPGQPSPIHSLEKGLFGAPGVAMTQMPNAISDPLVPCPCRKPEAPEDADPLTVTPPVMEAPLLTPGQILPPPSRCLPSSPLLYHRPRTEGRRRHSERSALSEGGMAFLQLVSCHLPQEATATSRTVAASPDSPIVYRRKCIWRLSSTEQFPHILSRTRRKASASKPIPHMGTPSGLTCPRRSRSQRGLS